MRDKVKMQRIRYLALMLCLVGSGSVVHAQDMDLRRKLEVSGHEQLTAPNDSARVTIAVVTQRKLLETARQKNATATKDALEALRRLGIKELKLETGSFNIVPTRDSKAKPYRIIGYQVRNSIVATLEELSGEDLSGYVSRIIDSAVAEGANEVVNINFYIKNTLQLERKALEGATAKAMEKARIIADAAGVTLKRIIHIRPDSRTPVPIRPRAMGVSRVSAAEATPIAAGEGQISGTVSITYEIE